MSGEIKPLPGDEHDDEDAESDPFNKPLVKIDPYRREQTSQSQIGVHPRSSAANNPVLFAREILRLEPDENQQKVLAAQDSNILLNCCRQWGKSFTAAIKAAHHAIYRPGSTILVLSRTLHQAGELFLRAESYLHRAAVTFSRDSINRHSLYLLNRSRLIAVPAEEENIRGISGVDLLIVDEAARVKDEVYEAVRPMLATTDGKTVLLSTPYHERGFFYGLWREIEKGKPAQADWLRLEIPATQCPRISKQYLENERMRHGERIFNQEYMCEFAPNEYRIFSRDLLEAAIDDTIEPLPGFSEDDLL
jgi:hypothetical protein